MNKFFLNKFAVLVALLSVFSGKTSGLNVEEIAEKASREGVSTGKSFFAKTSGVQKKSLSNPLKYALLSLGAAAAAGLGAAGYHVASSLFGEVAQGKKFFIEYFKHFGTNKIIFNVVKFNLFSNTVNICASINVGKHYREVTGSKLEGHELDKAIVNIKKLFYSFLDRYRVNLAADLFNIAYKYSVKVYGGEGLEDPDRFNHKVVVEPSDGKLSVSLLKEIPNDDEKGMIDQDVTAEFNIENPQTDEEKRKKGFYDELVKYVNNDDVMKQILLNE